MNLRRALRNGTVWIEHSLAFRSREKLFIPQQRWQQTRRAHYRRRSIKRLEQECATLKQAIEDHYDQHPPLKAQRELLQSVPGIGPVSADRMLCLLKRRDFHSARQAAAFAGLVPTAYDSGSSVHKPAHLSKQGDPQLRAVLYMAAVVASQHNRELRAHYQALVVAGKARMSALGALMRRLLHIAFGILKHNTPYNPQLVAKRC